MDGWKEGKDMLKDGWREGRKVGWIKERIVWMGGKNIKKDEWKGGKEGGSSIRGRKWGRTPGIEYSCVVRVYVVGPRILEIFLLLLVVNPRPREHFTKQ